MTNIFARIILKVYVYVMAQLLGILMVILKKVASSRLIQTNQYLRILFKISRFKKHREIH